jgi:AcrR family transcriptional regulator
MTDRASRAVERALDDRHRGATEEVERILDAAVRVMESAAPEPPRVSDIVAEAGSSNKAFYRYFASKDDVILAVMERGVAIVVSYLNHQMAKQTEPAAKVAQWIEGAMAQVANASLIALSRAATAQLAATVDRRVAEEEITRPMREMLTEPVRQLGVADPRRDADAVYLLTTATMRNYVATNKQPDRADIDNLVRFCMRALGVAWPPVDA